MQIFIRHHIDDFEETLTRVLHNFNQAINHEHINTKHQPNKYHQNLS